MSHAPSKVSKSSYSCSITDRDLLHASIVLLHVIMDIDPMNQLPVLTDWIPCVSAEGLFDNAACSQLIHMFNDIQKKKKRIQYFYLYYSKGIYNVKYILLF